MSKEADNSCYKVVFDNTTRKQLTNLPLKASEFLSSVAIVRKQKSTKNKTGCPVNWNETLRRTHSKFGTPGINVRLKAKKPSNWVIPRQYSRSSQTLH